MAVQPSFGLSTERCENIIGKRLVEVGTDTDSALQPPGLDDRRSQTARDGPATLRNDDFLPRATRSRRRERLVLAS